MAHQTTRVLIGFSIACVAAAWLFAWAVNLGRAPADSPSSASSTTTPAALFDLHCGACHGPEDLRRTIRDAADPEAYRRELLDLLTTHGDAAADDDQRIAAFLMGRRG